MLTLELRENIKQLAGCTSKNITHISSANGSKQYIWVSKLAKI